MIDIVYCTDVLAQLQQVTNRPVEIVRIERALIELRRILVFEQLDIELQPAHAREVVFPRIKEHAVEERRSGIQRRRIARTQLAIDLDQRFLRRLYRIPAKRLANHCTYVVPLREEDIQLDHAGSI